MAGTSICSAQSAELGRLYARLDSVIAGGQEYAAVKERKISELRNRTQPPSRLEERLWFNKMLYDEYVVYKADSAMAYANANVSIAESLGREDIFQEWKLNKVYLLTAQGLMNEAEKELRTVDFSLLGEDVKFKYFDTEIYLYSHFAQFSGDRAGMTGYYHEKEDSLMRAAEKYADPALPEYCSFYASLYRDSLGSDERERVKCRLKEIVDSSSLSTRTDAINAYSLASLYRADGDETECVKYLICSAIADVKVCNRDIASLEELSHILYSHGDIDRGYKYISYCLEAALQYPNRVRMVNISAVMDKFQQAYSEKVRIQNERLRRSFHTTGILSVILAISVLMICFQFSRLLRSRKKLAEGNKSLNVHIKELSETQDMLAKLNDELNEMNERLKTNNSQLFEANYVKEKYIGYVFSICSSYITKLEEYRKNIWRSLVVGRVDDIRKTVSDTSMTQVELKEFYRSFDAVFLQIYPDFVDDFNSLLVPDERIVLKKGELLNTELRIYALVRLGINDSVKIAEFLHCSPQTVYNNRQKTRNKLVISKEEFEKKVRTLGKIPE